jgi:hypothetical protein
LPDRLYHYTTREFAGECADEMDAVRPVMIEPSSGLYGDGVYALDLGYATATRQQLRWECFGESRPQHPMDGVLVIDPGLAEAPFAYVEGRIWLIESPLMPVAMDGAIVAIATWSQATGWTTVDYE